MPAGVINLTSDPLPDALTAELAEFDGPVWAIDARRRRVIATNLAGAERLGAEGGPEEALFDAAQDVQQPPTETNHGGDRQKRSPAPGVKQQRSRDAELAAWKLRPSSIKDSGIVLAEIQSSLPNTDDTPSTNGRGRGGSILRNIARGIRAGRTSEAPAKLPMVRMTQRLQAEDSSEGPEALDKTEASQGLHDNVTESGMMRARLAHELRTPIGAIAAAAEVMRDEELGPMKNDRYKSYAAEIAQNARHALELIERMLSAKTGTLNPPSKSAAERPGIDLNRICESVTAPLALVSERAGITLENRLSKTPNKIHADATELRQVLNNLLTNAIKFTPAGSRVIVTTGLSEEGEPTVRIADTGRGMTRAEIARALDRANPPPPERREGGGLGLGLPLVRSLAEANGAEVFIDSILGKGTEVTLVFRNKSDDTE